MPSFAPLRMPRMKPAATKRLKLLGVVAFAAVIASVEVIAPTVKEPAMHLVSGRAGLKTTAAGAHEKWAANKPVTIVLDGSLDTLGPGARAAVRDAFGTWAASGTGLPSLTIDNQSASGRAERDGVNRILVRPITIAGHEKDVAVTIGYADERTGALIEVDTIFNSKYAFAALDAEGTPAKTTDPSKTTDDKDDRGESSNCKKRYDLQNIATHEAGHFFGLGEDLDDAAATMYFSSAICETHKRALTGPDHEAMSGLYSVRATTGTVADQNGDVPSSDDPDGGPKGGCGARIAPVTSTGADASFAFCAVVLAAAMRRRTAMRWRTHA
jgi:hypothetical protein